MKNGFLLSAVSAVLMAAAWIGLGSVWLLIGMVPMLMLSARLDASARSFWKMAGWTALWLAIWYAIDVWWVWYATPAGPIAATIVAIMYLGTAFMLFHFVSKRAPKPLAYTVLVCAWIAAEYFYNIWQLSFPWLNIGNGFAREPWMVQWYEYTGVYGGTLWVLLTNILVYECIVAARPRRLLPPLAAALLPVAISLAIYFTYDIPKTTASVSVLQPNIDAWTEKFETPQKEQTDNLLSLAAQSPEDVQFIIMPETAVDENITEDNVNAAPSVRRFRRLLAKKYPEATIITGATTFRFYDTPATRTARQAYDGNSWYDIYNTAIGIDTSENTVLHHKNKLVIGAEMMPDWWWVRSLDRFILDLGGTTGHFGTDSFRRTFRSERAATASMICYESIYGAYVGQYVRRGAQFLCIITNDGWWGDTPGYKQHFSYARLRAVENRRSIARSANTGISGFINPRGEVMQSLGWDRRGALHADIPLNDRLTFYTRHGDYICSLAIYTLGLCMLYFLAYRVRRRAHLVD